MKVLVTGGAGLLGMALRHSLPAFGHEVVATDITDFGRDDPGLVRLPLSDIGAIEQLVLSHGIEAIVHGGGISGPVMLREDPRAISEINIGSTVGLLDICRRHGLKRFLLLSSHVVYGETGSAVIDEERAPHPSTTYAASKVAGEALVESFAREWGVSGASLRLTRVYGAHRRANCFLRQSLIDAAENRHTVIPCDETFPYHYVYVDDCVGAIAACLGAPALRHAAYNVTSGEVVTMPEVQAVINTVLSPGQVELVPGRDDAPELQADFSLSRITADTGWMPRFSLKKGFTDYAQRVARDRDLLN